MTNKPDAVNHPSHYGGGGNPYETIKKIAAKGVEYCRGFCLGNAEKYIDRAGKKEDDEIQDLKKARWYLDFFIRYLENDCRIPSDVPSENTAADGGRSRVWYLTEDKLPGEGELVVGFYPAGTNPVGREQLSLPAEWGFTLVLKKQADGWGPGINPPVYWIRLPNQ